MSGPAAGPWQDTPIIVGESPAIRALRGLVDQVAPVAVPVLLTGESGTGKEVVARAIHARSPRNGRPFVPVNCAALPENLVESEMFGHERGAFTGAYQAKPGRFEEADTGTLFLDEFAETSPLNQVKLLRALQESEIRRVGGTRRRPIDVRVLSASNRNVARALEDGSLREDLFYRLSVIHIHLPPLRDRIEDLPVLCEHFLRRFSARYGSRLTRVHPATMEALEDYRWPGNVRELANALERATVLSRAAATDTLEPAHLPVSIAGTERAGEAAGRTSPHLDLDAALQRVRQRYAMEALRRSDGNKAAAARLLGISRRGFYNLLRPARHGVQR